MMKRTGLASTLLVLAFFLVAFPPAWAQSTPVKPDAAPEQNLYLTGGQIHITSPVSGHVTATGNSVVIAAPVMNDVNVAGDTVNVQARLGDDLHAAGRTVTIAAPVNGDVVLAGETVQLTQAATVANAFLFGREVTVAGNVQHNLTANAARVALAGEVQGNAVVNAAALDVLPSAVIHGTLEYRGANAHIDPRAHIGRMVQLSGGPKPPGILARLLGSLMLVIVLGVVASVLYLVFPRFSVATAQLVGSAPWKCLGLGFGFILLAPLLMALLMMTVIGIPLGLILLALYIFLPFLGFLTGVLYLGETQLVWLHRDAWQAKGQTVLAMVVALVVLALVGYIPVIGGLLFIGVTLFGLGALLLQFYRNYRGPRAPAPAGQVAPAAP
jgi:uncharacterized membrane protein